LTSGFADTEATSSISSGGKQYLSYVPCLFLPYTNGSSKLLMYFHGNAEDIGLSYEMLDHLRSSLKINVLAVEYPGYGIYTDPRGCSSEKITEDSLYVFEYVMKETGLKEKDICVFGRSMGTGPATFIAANYNPGALILMSPYTSIRNVVQAKVGFLSRLVADRFNNLEQMPNVICPTFIVHGQKDTLIPYEHAQ
jgi:pimeloyl-ACP methyl ester carboxylesterase